MNRIVLPILLLASADALAFEVHCPATIETQQTIATRIGNGWSAVFRDAWGNVSQLSSNPGVGRSRLWGVSVSDGEADGWPADNEAEQDPRVPLYWTFENTEEARIYALCTYGSTSVFLKYPLPIGIKKCTAIKPERPKDEYLSCQ